MFGRSEFAGYRENAAPGKPLSSPFKGRYLLLILAGLMFLAFRNQRLAELSALELLEALGITILSLVPLGVWGIQKQREPPAFQFFCLVFFPYFAVPMINGNADFLKQPLNARLEAGLTVIAFLAIVNFVYYYNRSKAGEANPTSLIQYRRLPENVANMGALTILLGWVVITIGINFGYLGELMHPRTRNVISVFAYGGSTMAIWILARHLGLRHLKGGQIALFLGLVTVGNLLHLATANLLHPVIHFMVGTVAFTLGRGRIPVKTLLCGIMVIAFLNLAKGEIRTKYWARSGGLRQNMTLETVFEVYQYWIPTAYQKLLYGDQKRIQESSILNRATLINIQALVVSQTPALKPYLYGETYLYIPQLLVPRMFWEKKPSTHIATNELGMIYGLTNSVHAKTTTVSFGILAEAWANFGWLGIIGLALLIGGVMRGMSYALSSADPLTIHGMVAVLWVAHSFQIEVAASTWCATLSQTSLLLITLLYPFSRPVSRQATTNSSRPIGPGLPPLTAVPGHTGA
jgi:hypothetical protein